MKKLLIVAALSLTTLSAHADGWHHGDEWHHGGGHYVYRPETGWVVPAIVGGLIVYEATRPSPPPAVVVQPVAPAPVAVPPPSPVGYHWEALLDASCNCYRTVLVPN